MKTFDDIKSLKRIPKNWGHMIKVGAFEDRMGSVHIRFPGGKSIFLQSDHDIDGAVDSMAEINGQYYIYDEYLSIANNPRRKIMRNEYWIFKRGNKWYWKAIGFTGSNTDGSYGPFKTKKDATEDYELATGGNPMRKRNQMTSGYGGGYEPFDAPYGSGSGGGFSGGAPAPASFPSTARKKSTKHKSDLYALKGWGKWINTNTLALAVLIGVSVIVLNRTASSAGDTAAGYDPF